MNVYGVIDLKAGHVVRAVAGRRETYRPVRSVIARSSSPAAVARGFVERVGLRTAYVADLDAIAGRAPDWQALAAIADAGLSVVADAGCADLQRARDLAELRCASGALMGIVVGSESLAAEHTLPTLVQTIGADRAVFSLDLQAGHVLAAAETLRGKSPTEIADMAWQAGFRRIIVLDLSSVGVAAGPVTSTTCCALRAQHDWCELISGGGVRNVDDLRALERAGCDAALIATALHDGSLGRMDIVPWCTV